MKTSTERNQRTLRILGWSIITQFKEQLIYFLKNSNKGCNVWQFPAYHVWKERPDNRAGDQQLTGVGQVKALEPRHNQHSSGGELAERTLQTSSAERECSHGGLRGVSRITSESTCAGCPSEGVQTRSVHQQRDHHTETTPSISSKFKWCIDFRDWRCCQITMISYWGDSLNKTMQIKYL